MVAEVERLAIPDEVSEALGYYVYLLRDPRDGEVFYVGKGIGQRVYSHVNLAAVGKDDPDLAPAKVKRIRSILRAGMQVEHLFVRTGIEDDQSAYVVEQAVMDGLRAAGHPLTNMQSGHHSGTNGLSTVTDMVALLGAKAAPPLPPGSLVFIINRAWKQGDGSAAVYEATHGHWKVGARSRESARQAFGVARGVIRGVYKIDDWYPVDGGRWGFNGKPDKALQAFIGRHVREILNDSGPGSQNPVRLFL